jgi:hypothetical protein
MHLTTATCRVDTQLFTPVEVLTDWQHTLDQRGLRATGSPAHAAYVTDLADRLSAVGVQDVRLEPIPMRRWTPRQWALAIEQDGDHRDVPPVSYVAYSGSTGPEGVVGALSAEPAAGTIGLVDIPVVGMAAADFDGLDWDAPTLPVHGEGWVADARYERVWLSQDLMRDALARFEAAGAVGLVLVVDLPEDDIPGAYLLYDGVHRGIPAVFVGRGSGAVLRDHLAGGADVRLTLDAVVEDAVTHNVVGVVPGLSDEVVVLQSHTDGPNGLEDNGPEAIVAMAAHLATLPRGDLPRTVMVLLSTGHFAIEEAWGLEAFLATHAHDVVPRIAAAVSIEHLGALARPEDYVGSSLSVEHEFGACFATPHRALIDAARGAMDRARVTDSIVLRPFVPDTTGNSPDGTTWPGDGCPFWHTAGLPTINFITGPGYTFNVEPVLRYIDVPALRRQAIAFTEAVLQLAATPWDVLRAPVDPA